MARLLFKETSAIVLPLAAPVLSTARALSSAPTPLAAALDAMRRATSDRAFDPLGRKHLLLPSPPPSMKGFRMELVSDDLWAPALSKTLRPEEPPPDETAAGGVREEGGGGFGFDEIEDMRLRKKLFYKLERHSMEFEECQFSFHRKSSKKKERERAAREAARKESEAKEVSRVEIAGRGERGRGFERSGARVGKGEPSLELNCGDETGRRANEGRSRCSGVANKDIRLMRSLKVDILGIGSAPSSSRVQVSYGSRENKESTHSRLMMDRGARLREADTTSIVDPVTGYETRLSLQDSKKLRTPTYNQSTDPYHLPFCLDIYISKGSVRACITHRPSSRVVAVADSISKDMKFDLKSKKDSRTCASIGVALAQRAIADDIHNVVYTPRKGEKIEGKLQIVLQSIIDHGIDVKLKLKQKKPVKITTMACTSAPQ